MRACTRVALFAGCIYICESRVRRYRFDLWNWVFRICKHTAVTRSPPDWPRGCRFLSQGRSIYIYSSAHSAYPRARTRGAPFDLPARTPTVLPCQVVDGSEGDRRVRVACEGSPLPFCAPGRVLPPLRPRVEHCEALIAEVVVQCPSDAEPVSVVVGGYVAECASQLFVLHGLFPCEPGVDQHTLRASDVDVCARGSGGGF